MGNEKNANDIENKKKVYNWNFKSKCGITAKNKNRQKIKIIIHNIYKKTKIKVTKRVYHWYFY